MKPASDLKCKGFMILLGETYTSTSSFKSYFDLLLLNGYKKNISQLPLVNILAHVNILKYATP